MNIINVRGVVLKGDCIKISATFRRFEINVNEISRLKIYRVPSFFEEIGMELSCGRTFLVSERISGFFELAKVLNVEGIFGPFWYRDAGEGLELEQVFENPAGAPKT